MKRLSILILLFFVMFINVNNANAKSITTQDGFARCIYTGTVQDGVGNYVASAISVVIRVYRDTGGVVRSYANMRCSESYTEMNAGGAAMSSCPINNYNDLFRHAQEKLYPTFGEGSWRCPGEIYVNVVPQYPGNGGNISLTSQNGYTKISLNSKYSQMENEAVSFESDDDSGDFVKVGSVADAVQDAYDEANGNRTDVDSDVMVNTIAEWAADQGYNIDSIGDPCNIISPNLRSLLNTIFWTISIVGVILVVVMTAISFIKAIVGSDDEKFKTAFSHLITRLIVVFILLLLPMFLTFIINIINDNMGGTVKVGADGDVFCDITK